MILSNLAKTFIFDLDGTLLAHNGYKHEKEELLTGVKEFFDEYVTTEDCVIMITARKTKFKEETINFLRNNNIPFDHIIFDLPHGERLLFNDKKNSGLKTAHCVNLSRDEGLSKIKIQISEVL